MQPEVLLTWQAPSRVEHDRSKTWYVVAGTVAVSLIVYGILSGSWTFSFCIGLLVGLFVLTRDHAHPVHTISITTLGIELDGKLHTWNTLKKFWLLIGTDYAELHISVKKRFQPNIRILTGTTDPSKILEVLSPFLPHDEAAQEGLFDIISRLCKL